jgi:mRNA interferase MazF
MKRAEIWTVSGGPDYAGKPRPAVILQDDAFEGTASVTLCPFTTHLVDAPLIRLPVVPTTQNGLGAASQLMADKLTTVARSKLHERVGKLADEDMIRLNRAVLVFLGLTGRSKN